MKKFICASLCMLICAGVFTGCGKTIDSDTSMIYVNKKGAVVSVDVEELGQSYYDETELKSFVDDAIADYTSENGKNAVKVADLSVENKSAKLKMKYKSTDDYSKFNGIELYQGKVVKALAAGYDFDADFVCVEDGKVTGSASKEDIYAADDLKVLIIKANTDVKIDGTICYVSTENVQLTGSDSVSIRDGYQVSGAEESAASTETVNDTDSSENLNVTDEPQNAKDGSFETEVYTYIVYK